MQVNTINFTGRRDNIDAFINLDDEVIGKSAALKTLRSINTKKHKNLDNALTYSLPLAGGIAMAAGLPKGFRRTGFVIGALDWGLFLAGAGIASKALKIVNNKVDAVKDFTENHRLLSGIGTFAAAVTAGIGLERGGFKAIAKALNSKAFEKFSAKSVKIADKFPKTKEFAFKINNVISNGVNKIHPAIKSPLKWAAGILPWALIIGSFAHSANHSCVVNSTFRKNYSEMKEKQLELARQRNHELAFQNDFLLTNPKNQEDLNLFKKHA